MSRPVPPAVHADPVHGRTVAAHATEPPQRSLASFWRSRYWPAWCLVSWLRLTALLPLEVALAIHRAYGRAMYALARRQRHVVRRNLELCFPKLGPAERERLVRHHFESLGMSLAECAFAWFAPDRRLARRFAVRGVEHVRNALAEGNGAILYTGHFGSLEICGRPLKLALPFFACVFSRRSNALLDEVQRRGRLRVAHESIPSDHVRATLRALKRGAAVWYAPDQMHSHGVVLPFFGEPAMTNVATSKLARLSGAPIVPFSYRRVDDGGHYELVFHRALTDLPTADPIADTRALVQRLEEFVRAAPEQYQWLHRRFKGRPANLPDPYQATPAPAPACGALQQPNPAAIPAGLALSVVIPLNNERANVQPLLEEIARVLGAIEYEVIVVDDGSTDGTLEELRCVAAQLGRVRVLTHNSRRGQSTAIYNGIRAARHELVATLDGDLQNDPRDILALLDRYLGASDKPGLIIGHRVRRRDSAVRRLSSRFANALRSRVLGDATPDTGCGMKLMRRSVFLALPYFDHMHRFLPALTQRAGYRVMSVPVHHRPRLHAEAHYGTWDRAWVGLVDLVGVAWLMRRSRPLQVEEDAH